MHAGRRRTALADVSAGLLIVSAAIACAASIWNNASIRDFAIPVSAFLVVSALILASIVWRERRAKWVIASAILALCIGGGAKAFEFVWPSIYAAADDSKLPSAFKKLEPLHKPLGEQRSGDWLDEHVEPGQTYSQYISGETVRSDDRRRTIYVQPLGEFNTVQRKILRATAEFLGLYFQLPVRISEDLPLSPLPENAWRKHPAGDTPQLLTNYVLQELLKPRLPSDAAAMIGLTAADLTPGGDWNYVFGQAMLADRVGVWSMHRLGNPEESEDAYLQTLRRMLHIAAHETGHMFSIEHCIFYECCMCGANHREELDRQPLWLCPKCQAKVTYATGADPVKQFADLAAFAETHDLKPEAAFWRKSLATFLESQGGVGVQR